MSDAAARAREIAAQLVAGNKRKLGDPAGPGPGESQPRKLTNKIRKTVYVPVEQFPGVKFLGLILGPRGSSHKALEAETGCRVLIRGKGTKRPGAPPQEGDDLPMHCIVIGDSEANVQSCEAKLKKILFNPHVQRGEQAAAMARMPGYQGTSNAIQQTLQTNPVTGQSEKVITIDNSHTGLVIGKGGDTIKRLQAQAGCRIRVQSNSEVSSGSKTRYITITGGLPQIEVAERLINEIVEDARRKDNMRNSYGNNNSNGTDSNGGNSDTTYSVVLPIQVPNYRVGLIIGKGGSTIKGIQRVSGANINIPNQPDSDNPEVRTLTISAHTMEQVQRAQKELQKVVDNDPDSIAQQGVSTGQIIRELDVPNTVIGLVIGRGGSTIQGIQQRSGCHCKIPKDCHPGMIPPVRRCVISGHTQASVDNAVAQIMAIMNGTPVHMLEQVAANARMGGGGMGMPTGAGGMMPNQQGGMGMMYGQPNPAMNMYGQQQPMRGMMYNQGGYNQGGGMMGQGGGMMGHVGQQPMGGALSTMHQQAMMEYGNHYGRQQAAYQQQPQQVPQTQSLEQQWRDYYNRDPQGALKLGYDPNTGKVPTSNQAAQAQNGSSAAGSTGTTSNTNSSETTTTDYSKQWEEYYRKDPAGARKNGYVPSPALEAEVEGGKGSKASTTDASDATSSSKDTKDTDGTTEKTEGKDATNGKATAAADQDTTGNGKESEKTKEGEGTASETANENAASGGGDPDETEAEKQWAAYYRSNPEDAIARGYVPPPELVKEVEEARKSQEKKEDALEDAK